jgi:serine/threonine-protein kinase
MAACPQCQSPYDAEAHRFCPTCGFPVGEVGARPDDPLIGKTFPGGYVLLELIGVGGMGRVYRAEQKALGRTVAVKVIHPHLHGEEGAAARFITEARAASRLNHPNVVGVIDFGRTNASDGGLLYLVMEFLRGSDLGRVAYDEGPLAFPRIVDILKQTLGALDEAHHLGIIHRDVKPENIVLEPTRGGRDFVKVVDFGLAKLRPDMLTGIVAAGGTGITSPGIVCGTPDYMSPEQGRGDPLDPRSDLYALGVIMFQLLTGQLPFEAASPTQVVLMHLQQPPPDPRKLAPERKIPDPLADVCLTALQKDRNRRYADAQTFIRALDAALAASSTRPSSGALAGAKAVPCPQCRTDVPAGQKFCGECGARIVVSNGVPTGRPLTPPPTATATTQAAPLTTREPRTPGRLPLPLPLLGRDDDLQWLADRRHEAANQPRAARLVGEVGVGKTRLLAEFLGRARDAGDRVIEASPDPFYAEIGYFGLADLIEKLTGITAATDLARVVPSGDVLVGIQEIVTRPVATKTHEPTRRYAVATALRWAIERAARDEGARRLIIALDDLPRFDGATRHALSDVLGEPPMVSVLFISTHPPGFDAGWPAGRSLARVIAGLPTSIAASALRGLSPQSAASAEARLEVAGNRGVAPLYLDQLVRFAHEAGGAAPARVADLIALRIERLGADVRRVLQAAAIIGDDVGAASIGRLLPSAAGLEAALGRGVAAGILEESIAGFRFAHPLFREVAAATIPAGARRDLHARAQELASEEGAPIEVRALHAFYAQNALEALLLLEQVGDRCTRRGDDEGAILSLRRALELARRALFRGDLDDPERAVVIFSRKLGDALARVGSLTDAEGILREALDLAGPADIDRAKVLEGLAKVARARERFPEATALLREAIATAGRSGARELKSSLESLENAWRAAS